MALEGLACTGDPLLDLMLAECSSFRLRPVHCETIADVLRETRAAKPPDLLFTSPALGDPQPLRDLPGLRICWLWEGPNLQAPEGVERLSAERLTPELIDAWVRRPGRGQRATQSHSILPPPLRRPAAPVPPPAKVSRRISAAPPQEAGGPGGPGGPGGGQPRVTIQRRVPKERAPRPIWAALREAVTAPVPAPVEQPAARRPVEPPRRPTRPQPERPRANLSVLRQQVVTLWGGKPGAGRSTLAIGLSDLLARAGEIRVCTVDLNPHNSSLAALLGKEQEVPSWFHLSEALSRSLPFPTDSLRWLRPNWALISGPDGKPDWVSRLDGDSIAWLVEGLRSQFDYIILDPEARPGPISEAAVRLAQLVLVTVSADYPDVLDTVRAFEGGLEGGWLDRSRCRLILNRWLDSPHLKASEVADCFSLPVSLSVPLSPEVALQASGRGIPVTQLEGPAAAAMQQVLGRLVGLVAPTLATAMGASTGLGGQLRSWFAR